MNIFSFVYLAVFLLAGFCIARRALPQAGLSVSIPLGCGFGVSLLAFVPACFAVVLGFRLPALLLAAAVVAALAVWLARHGTPFTRVPDPDAAALWACVLPLAVVTLYLLHTHVLHLVDGSYHTGQSCYGDMAMHLGFIKNIAVTGKLPPVYPLLGGEHRFGYPFLCETVSSVFLVLGADARTAYLLPMLAAFISVYGMMWQLARQVLGSAGKACLAFWLFFMGSGFGFVYFLGSAEAFAGIFTGFYTTPTNYTAENIVWVNPIVDLLIPQRATLFGWCVLFPALYLVWRFCMEEETRLWRYLALLVLPLPLMHTHSALALVLICLACGASCTTWGSARRPSERRIVASWQTHWRGSWRADAPGKQEDGAIAMIHDFTLVYALSPELNSQDEVMHRLAGSDCADATVGWGRPGHVALAFSREAMDCNAAVALAVAQMRQVLLGASLVRTEAASP